MYVYVCICRYRHVYACIGKHLCIYVCICMYMHEYACICMYMCKYVCICMYMHCDLTIYHHNHTIQHAVGPHQVSWLDVLAQASPGSGRAVDLRTSLAIWLLWPGPHIGSGNPYPFAFRSPSFCLPAWSILDICRAWNDLEAQPGKDSLQCVTWDDLTGIDIFFLSVSLELSSLQTCCHLHW